MEINVIEDDLLCNIQHSFRAQYPHLKLLFYKSPYREADVYHKAILLDENLPMEEVTMFHTAGRIDIGPERTVAAVEKDFFHKLGLSVQIVRQSGDLWIAAVNADLSTLYQQNEEGKARNTSWPKQSNNQ